MICCFLQVRECQRITSTIDKQFVDPAHDGFSIYTQHLDVDLGFQQTQHFDVDFKMICGDIFPQECEKPKAICQGIGL